VASCVCVRVAVVGVDVVSSVGVYARGQDDWIFDGTASFIQVPLCVRERGVEVASCRCETAVEAQRGAKRQEKGAKRQD